MVTSSRLTSGTELTQEIFDLYLSINTNKQTKGELIKHVSNKLLYKIGKERGCWPVNRSIMGYVTCHNLSD